MPVMAVGVITFVIIVVLILLVVGAFAGRGRF
jgi:hypothetical protein